MITTQGLRRILNLATADATKLLGEVTIKLYKAAITLGPGMVAADFTEADYTGYVGQTAGVSGAVWDDPSGNGVQSYVGLHFQPSDDAAPNTIFGWYALGKVAPAIGELVWAQEFPEPVTLNNAFDALDFVPVIKIGPPAGAG